MRTLVKTVFTIERNWHRRDQPARKRRVEFSQTVAPLRHIPSNIYTLSLAPRALAHVWN